MANVWDWSFFKQVDMLGLPQTIILQPEKEEVKEVKEIKKSYGKKKRRKKRKRRSRSKNKFV